MPSHHHTSRVVKEYIHTYHLTVYCYSSRPRVVTCSRMTMANKERGAAVSSECCAKAHSGRIAKKKTSQASFAVHIYYVFMDVRVYSI